MHDLDESDITGSKKNKTVAIPTETSSWSSGNGCHKQTKCPKGEVTDIEQMLAKDKRDGCPTIVIKLGSMEARENLLAFLWQEDNKYRIGRTEASYCFSSTQCGPNEKKNHIEYANLNEIKGKKIVSQMTDLLSEHVKIDVSMIDDYITSGETNLQKERVSPQAHAIARSNETKGERSFTAEAAEKMAATFRIINSKEDEGSDKKIESDNLLLDSTAAKLPDHNSSPLSFDKLRSISVNSQDPQEEKKEGGRKKRSRRKRKAIKKRTRKRN